MTTAAPTSVPSAVSIPAVDISSVDAFAPTSAKGAARKNIRGSMLLFVGRLLSKLANFVVHVLIVRYLSQADFGAFAYALSFVQLGAGIADFGMHRAISRYVPIYHERREYGKAVGTVLMALSLTICLGGVVVLAAYCGQGYVARHFISDQQAVQLLLILVLLSPIEALDKLLVGLFAVLASPRAIFFRRYVLAPGLRIAVVLLLMLGGLDVRYLAAGYVAAGAIGVAICGVVLWRLLQTRGELATLRQAKREWPWREVLWFSIPLLTTDITYLVMHAVNTLILGNWGGTVEVASLRAVYPTAKLNQLVFLSFGVLFTPQAARLFARDDHKGINDLYWQSAVWTAVMTFPIFLMTFSLARPLTILLFGKTYEHSGVMLALLSLGYYVQAALGFNGTTLTIYRKIKFIVGLNIVAALINLGVSLVLIPKYGALGAAIAICSGLIVHNLLKQAGLLLGTGINVFEWQYLRVYLCIIGFAVTLLLIHLYTNTPFAVDCLLAAVSFVLLVRVNRRLLDVEATFPRLMRLPLMPLLLGKHK